MKQFTQLERQEIRKAVEKKYGNEIKLIHAKHPRLEEQLDKQATDQAVKLLGVEKLVKQRETLQKQLREIEQSLEIVNAQISEKMPNEKSSYRGSCPRPMELCDALKQKKETILPALKEKHATYSRIVKLECKRDADLRKVETFSNREQLAESGILDETKIANGRLPKCGT